MRITVSILTFLICTASYGQASKYEGTWISSSNDVIFIKESVNKYDHLSRLCTALEDENMSFYLLGDTLSFQNEFYTSTNYEKAYVARYDLIIIKKTDTSITVKPVSYLSIKYFNKRTSITFIKQEFNKDKSIAFKKIIYHTTTCYGSCPKIDLEIDNKRNIYLSGEFYKNGSMLIDSIESGEFVGKLTDTLYNQLIDLLQTCNLRALTFPERNGNDAPVTTLIIYYNGYRKYLKSMFPPTIAYKLINFLYDLRENAELTRTNEKRKLEE